MSQPPALLRAWMQWSSSSRPSIVWRRKIRFPTAALHRWSHSKGPWVVSTVGRAWRWPPSIPPANGRPMGPRAPRPGFPHAVISPAEARGQLRRGRALPLHARRRAGLLRGANRGGPGRRVGQGGHGGAARVDQEAFARDEAVLVEAANELKFAALQRRWPIGPSWPTPTGPKSPTWRRRARRDVYVSQTVGGMWLGKMTFDPIGGAIYRASSTGSKQCCSTPTGPRPKHGSGATRISTNWPAPPPSAGPMPQSRWRYAPRGHAGERPASRAPLQRLGRLCGPP